MISGASDEELDIAIARADVLLELQSKIDELKKENQELKKQLEVGKQQYNDLVEEKEKLQEQLSSNTLQFENQQKEFIEYLENEINKFKELEKFAIEVFDNNKIINIGLAKKTIEENNLLIAKFNMILSKYKEIIEDKE